MVGAVDEGTKPLTAAGPYLVSALRLQGSELVLALTTNADHLKTSEVETQTGGVAVVAYNGKRRLLLLKSLDVAIGSDKLMTNRLVNRATSKVHTNKIILVHINSFLPRL